MKTLYHIDHVNNVIIETLEGEADVSSYIELKEKVFQDKDFTPNLNVILDLRRTDIKGLQKQSLRDLLDFYISHTDKMSNRRSAVITETPSQAANTIYFFRMAYKLPMNMKIFSSIESALTWIKEK